MHFKVFLEACNLLQILEPIQFNLRLINSTSVLLFWRCVLVILESCTPAQHQQFYPLVPSENRSTIKKVVNESSDSELPSDLEEFIVVDAAESD